MKPLLKMQSKMTNTWGHFKKSRIKIYFVCAQPSFRISFFFLKLNYNNNNNKTINGVAGHNTPIIKSSVVVGKIPHKALINISKHFSYETSMAAEQFDQLKSITLKYVLSQPKVFENFSGSSNKTRCCYSRGSVF